MFHKISTSVKRLDSFSKARGDAQYIDDIDFGEIFHALLITSQISRGVIKVIKLPYLPEGYNVVTKDDVPMGGKNVVNIINLDWPAFATEEVNYYGQTIGLIVGPDKNKLFELLNKIEIVYEEKEGAFTIDEGLNCKGGPIYGHNNLFVDYNFEKGNPTKAFNEAYRVIEEEYETPFQEQVYMETQGMVGLIEDGKLTLYASCQCPFYIKKALCTILNLETEKVVVKQTVTGGGFGGKENFPSMLAAVLMVAVNKIRKPIKLILDRKEDMTITSKRHSSRTKIRAALDKNDYILGLDIDMILNGGAYESCSKVVLQRAIFHINSVYDFENVKVRGRAVATNTVPTDAFRGFGTPQAVFAIELFMSHLAKLKKENDVIFKKHYFIKRGGKTVTNGIMHTDVKLEEMWAAIKEKCNYEEKVKDFGRGNFKGVGAAFYLHGGGFTGDGEFKIIKSKVKLRILKGGYVEILASNVEMGQGVLTTFCKIVAEELNIPLDRVIYQNPDTSRVPDSGPTVASRSIFIVGKLLQKAAAKLKEKWNLSDECEVEENYESPVGLFWDGDALQGDAYVDYSYGICVVEVLVDPITFEVKTIGIWSIHDVGTPIDLKIVEGQICGGILQAMGYGYLEKLELKNGRYYQNTMTDYIIPTSLDFPTMDIMLFENTSPFGPFGAKGVGELPFDGAAAAFTLAVSMAIDRDLKKIPVTPEYIFEVLRH
jgi:CO/xanthine dehydrogenase Mo-binding subunit